MRYEMTPQEERKHAIKTMIACLIIGGLFIAFSSAVFFGYCRPFTKFEYYECIIKNREWFEIDNDRYHVKVIYYVDGIKYEKEMSSRPRGRTKICFYYNAKNPNDTISADREFFLIAMPIIAGLGGLLALFGTNFFLKWKKKDKKEFIEWKKKRDNNEKKP